MNPNFTATFTVYQSPEAVFNAVNNVRGWWSEEIEGDTDRLGAAFNYHYKDVHRCVMQITEFVPNQKVVWHVLENHFDFIQDQSEWVGTDVVFAIVPQGGKTELHFTHVGLVPAYECYEICANAWGTYITLSLRDLITTGKGQPNPIEEVVEQAEQKRVQNYTASFVVEQSPEVVFDAINNVRGWWSEDIEGKTDKLGTEFVFFVENMHRTAQKITEFVPNQKVVWHVTESWINHAQDKNEWKDTDIIFDIRRFGGNTELRFTHVGLMPAIECYDRCSDAWSFYIKSSLKSLITNGKGQPSHNENREAAKNLITLDTARG